MTKNELIKSLKCLKEIKPSQDWAVSVKTRILGQLLAEKRTFITVLKDLRFTASFVFSHKYAFATAVCLIVLMGVFGVSMNSLPGDPLYPLKKATEAGQSALLLNNNVSRYNLEIANKRLDDLVKIAKAKTTKNLQPALDEFKASVSEAAKSLSQNTAQAKDVVEQMKMLEDKTKEIKSLGVDIGETQELDNVMSQLVDREIKSLETKTLTDEQKTMLEEVKKDFADGNYASAMEKILIISQ